MAAGEGLECSVPDNWDGLFPREDYTTLEKCFAAAKEIVTNQFDGGDNYTECWVAKDVDGVFSYSNTYVSGCAEDARTQPEEVEGTTVHSW